MQKKDRSPCSFRGKCLFISLASLVSKRNCHVNVRMTKEIVRSKDAQCNTEESPSKNPVRKTVGVLEIMRFLREISNDR